MPKDSLGSVSKYGAFKSIFILYYPLHHIILKENLPYD